MEYWNIGMVDKEVTNSWIKTNARKKQAIDILLARQWLYDGHSTDNSQI